jgi:Zn-dependent peptidase ImmA (M78 family)
MVTLAREYRGLTQGSLAKKLRSSQGKVSKFENGMLAIGDDDAKELGRVLEFDPEFFYQTTEIEGLGSTFLFNRKRRNVPIRVQRQIQAAANVMRMQAERLLRGAEIVSANKFERLDIDADRFGHKPERVARYIRAVWGVPLGPVANVTRVIEAAGGIIFKYHFGTDQIDAAHLWPAGLPPMFFMNADMPGDRHRFNLAHELGHALMHRFVAGECESEANEFASEFLMPREEIGKHLDSMTIEKAARLKAQWRVSMHAIIYRAQKLGKISERHAMRLFQLMGAKGYRKREPVEIPFEEPNTVRTLMKVHRDHHHYSDADLQRLIFHFDPQFYSQDHVPLPPDDRAPLKLFG